MGKVIARAVATMSPLAHEGAGLRAAPKSGIIASKSYRDRGVFPPRFYTPEARSWHTAPQTPWDLPPETAYHALVRRVLPGNPIRLFDGAGREWEGVVVAVGRRTVTVDALQPVTPLPEPPTPRVLATALLPAERLDWVVQKGTELGMTHWVPLVTARSQVGFDAARAEKKRRHWQQVAANACAQCGRATVPEILPVTPLTALAERLAEWVTPPITWFWLQPGGTSVAKRAPPMGGVVLLVGPEGGWHPEEERYFAQHEAVALGLAPWVLRAETAAVAALAQTAVWWSQ